MKAASCNGCRILRKGCREDCIIRPCIEWIVCPESQANATLFLAKYYGRAGLVNLIHAGYESQRISLFKSLLYEACGRILNPVYGSLGLLYSGNWYQCEAAVRSVLRGSFTATGTKDATSSMELGTKDATSSMELGTKDATSSMELSIAGCDIRNAWKNKSILPSPKKSRGTKPRTRSKRPISEVDCRVCSSAEDLAQPAMVDQGKVGDFMPNLTRREKKIKETVKLESSLRLPSTSMADLASPMSQANTNDQFDISLKLSL